MNGDGIIQPEEFRKVLMCQKVYTEEQMNFLLEVADKDSDGRISYKEFSERFSDPASEIGFNIALLFTNLSEHTTNDPRLDKLVEAAADLIDVFESQLGRIEILGGTKRIERVYFEISEENKSSWEAETIKVGRCFCITMNMIFVKNAYGLKFALTNLGNLKVFIFTLYILGIKTGILVQWRRGNGRHGETRYVCQFLRRHNLRDATHEITQPRAS